jgi:hypothetical protein
MQNTTVQYFVPNIFHAFRTLDTLMSSQNAPIVSMALLPLYTIKIHHKFRKFLGHLQGKYVQELHKALVYLMCIYNYERGPLNHRNLNVARELQVVARCAARCRESTQ